MRERRRGKETICVALFEEISEGPPTDLRPSPKLVHTRVNKTHVLVGLHTMVD